MNEKQHKARTTISWTNKRKKSNGHWSIRRVRERERLSIIHKIIKSWLFESCSVVDILLSLCIVYMKVCENLLFPLNITTINGYKIPNKTKMRQLCLKSEPAWILDTSKQLCFCRKANWGNKKKPMNEQKRKKKIIEKNRKIKHIEMRRKKNRQPLQRSVFIMLDFLSSRFFPIFKCQRENWAGSNNRKVAVADQKCYNS